MSDPDKDLFPDYPSGNELNFEKIANYNELIEHLDDIAGATKSYYDKLITLGFPEEVARTLMYEWHSAYWRGNFEVGGVTIVNEASTGDER